MPQIFISYSRDDREFVVRLAEQLTRAGHSVWWDAGLHAGRRFEDEIDAALKAANVVLVLWSRTAVQSDWVRAEAEFARKRKIAVPALIDDTPVDDLPLLFHSLHTIDMRGWAGESDGPGFKDLLRSIDERVVATATTTSEPTTTTAPQPAPPTTTALPVTTTYAPATTAMPTTTAPPAAIVTPVTTAPPHEPPRKVDAPADEVSAPLAARFAWSPTRRIYAAIGAAALLGVVAVLAMQLGGMLSAPRYAECGTATQVKSPLGDFSLCLGAGWERRNTSPSSYFNSDGSMTFYILNRHGTFDIARAYPGIVGTPINGEARTEKVAGRTWRVQPSSGRLDGGGTVEFLEYQAEGTLKQDTALLFSGEDGSASLATSIKPILESAVFIR